MPPMATFAQPSAQPMVKLSKLVKEARQFDCETFSSTIDVVATKNWLKKVSNTLTDMDLDADLKLKVESWLINKSAATGWDNLKLKSNTPVT